MASCPYCGSTLAAGPPWAPDEGRRLAYDPEKGRLWNVCSSCSRWVLTPLEDRWETLEACEAAVEREGRTRVSTSQLSLMQVGAGELIRVGQPLRREFVDWRYGPRLERGVRRGGFWARLLSRLPAPPVGGYDPYRGFEGAMRSEPWLASPFLEHASGLTYLFSCVPLAPECPACRGPLALNPWDFQALELLIQRGSPEILAVCALCDTEVVVELAEARPAMRMGLGLVSPPQGLKRVASAASEGIDSLGGAPSFLEVLSSAGTRLGELELHERAGLIITLDEMAEIEALEREWKEAEEMAAILDGELSEVPGFESFRKRILEENP